MSIEPGKTRIGWIGTGVMGAEHVRAPAPRGLRRHGLQPHAGSRPSRCWPPAHAGPIAHGRWPPPPT